jgi:hypothetical protein
MDDSKTGSDVDSSDDDVTVEDTLLSLKRQTGVVQNMLIDCIHSFKAFQTKAKDEVIGPLSDIPLVPKPRLQAWLRQREMPADSNFHTFFEKFLHEHHKERKCDVSDRTIHLNNDACVLFGYKSDTKVHLFDILEKLSVIYE